MRADHRLPVSRLGRRLAGIVTTAVILVASLFVPNIPTPWAAQATAEQTESLNAVGPPLLHLETKLKDRGWLLAWLLRPSQLRPGTTMPDFDLTVEEAQTMVSYLLPEIPPAADDKWRGGDATLGAETFTTRGCRGCHAIAPNEESISPRVPNLAGVGLKVQAGWIARWLESPRAYHSVTAMPSMKLSEAEVRNLIAFLLSRRDGAEIVAAAPRGAAANVPQEQARDLLRRYECHTCHNIRGLPEPEYPFLDPTPVGERPADLLRDGRMLTAYYNCRGCHRLEGSGGAIAAYLKQKVMAPPTLEGEGARVQSSWLIEFLQHPRTLRPWLQMRMPDFGLTKTQARALAGYMRTLAGVKTVDEPHEQPAAGAVDHGLRRFALFQCVQCHPTAADGKLPPGIDPENLAINLSLAKTRLRPSWIRKFLADPKAVVGNDSRMPSVFYTSDGKPKTDDPDGDIAAITDYLINMTEPPEVSLARLEAERKKDNEADQVDWSAYDY